MLKKQYVSMRLLPIIVVFTLAFGFMTVIQRSESYADESTYPTTALKVVGATEEATWQILKTMPFKDQWSTADNGAQFMNYELGKPIERTWDNTSEEGVVPWWSIKLSELRKCGVVTGIALTNTDGQYLQACYANNQDVIHDMTSLTTDDFDFYAFGENAYFTNDKKSPRRTSGECYCFSNLTYNTTSDQLVNHDSLILLESMNNEKYAEVYLYRTAIPEDLARERFNTEFIIYFNGEERKLRFDVEDEDLTVEVGKKSTRVAKTQSSYYPENAVISYTSSDDSIATVDVSSGEVTGVAEGEATITASIQDGDKEISKSYTVIVSKASDPAVDAVIAEINAIGEVTLDEECEARIDAARQAYNNLTDEQKSMIDAGILGKLTSAEEALAHLKQQQRVNEVTEAIDAIGEITQNNYTQKEETVNAAREAFDALSDEDKALVGDKYEQRLVNAENKLEIFKLQKENEDRADEISDLKELTAEQAVALDAANTLIDSLTIQLSELKASSEADEGLIANLEDQLEKLRDVAEKLAQSTATKEELTTQITELNTTITKLNQQITDLQNKETAQDALNNKKKTAVEQINKYVKDNLAGIDDVDKMEIEIAALKGILAVKDAEKEDDITAEVEKFKDVVDTAVEKFEAKNLKVTGLKATSKKKKFTVKWTLNKKAEAYDVQYKLSSAKKFSSLKKGVTTRKVTSKKLKKGKKYIFRVRTVKTVGGKKIYGKWVKTKAVKCK